MLVDSGRHTKDAEELAESVRSSLGASLYERLVDKNGDLNVLTIAPALEGYMLSAVRNRDGTGGGVLPPVELERFIKSVAREAERQLGNNVSPVLMCSPQLRRLLRSLLSRAVPHLAVLSVTEVGRHARVSSGGVIDVPGFPNKEAA